MKSRCIGKECDYSDDLFAKAIPVWYQDSGKVNPERLSICKEERNQTTDLLEQITSFSNLQKAYKQVRRNGGSSGVDQISIKDFGEWFSENYQELQSQILQGNYQPQSVRGVQIPKPRGGFRQLGIPTVQDRVVQQAISQVLQRIFDPKFSLNSYGFRPKRNAHQALLETRKIVKTGKKIIVDLDLAKFFAELNHQRLMWMLSTRIGDKRLLKLILKILKTNIMQNALEEQRIKGSPQEGGALRKCPVDIFSERAGRRAGIKSIIIQHCFR